MCNGSLQLQLQLFPQQRSDMILYAKRVALQAAWLQQHSSMVGRLQLLCPGPPRNKTELAMQVALRRLLQLQSLQLRSQGSPAALLRQLNASRLTNLHWTTPQDQEKQAEIAAMASALLAAALGRLTSLQELAITGSCSAVDSSITPALAGMPQLTRLVLQPQLPAAAIAQLPGQLLHLQLSNPDCEAATLVANVRQLQQLQSLALLYNNEVLQEAIIVSHAAVWPALPVLQQLDLEFWSDEPDADSGLSADIAASIAGSASLTRLYCWFWTGKHADVDLNVMLAPLSKLHTLKICLNGRGSSGGGGLDFEQLSGSLTGLKQLSVCIGYMRPLMLFCLCYGARQLTHLVLSNTWLTDEGLEVIACNLKQLRQLGLLSQRVGYSVTVQGVVDALTPPQPPELEQFGFVAGTGASALKREELAVLASRLQELRPSLHVLTAWAR
jgi:hypothetical protein